MSDGETTYSWTPGTDFPTEVDNFIAGTQFKCGPFGRLYGIQKDDCSEVLMSIPFSTDPDNDNSVNDIEFSDPVDQLVGGGFGKDGTCIQSIECCEGRMWLLSNNEINFITEQNDPTGGSDLLVSSTFAQGIGPVGPKATICCANDVFFWDATFGLMRIGNDENGNLATTNPGSKICDINQDMIITDNQSNVAMGCCNGRVWMSIPTIDPSCNDTTYVFDPATESFTKYDFGIECFFEMDRAKGKNYCLGLTKTSVVMLDQMADFDDFGDGEGDQKITGEFYTRFYDDDFEEGNKRWCGVEYIIDPSPGLEMEVRGFGDWSDCNLVGSEVIDASPIKSQNPFVLKESDEASVIPVALMERCAPGEDPVPLPKVVGPDAEVLKPIPEAPITVRSCATFCPSKSIQLCFRNITAANFCVYQMTFYYYSKELRC